MGGDSLEWVMAVGWVRLEITPSAFATPSTRRLILPCSPCLVSSILRVYIPSITNSLLLFLVVDQFCHRGVKAVQARITTTKPTNAITYRHRLYPSPPCDPGPMLICTHNTREGLLTSKLAPLVCRGKNSKGGGRSRL